MNAVGSLTPRRVNVVGSTGSGKTTFAAALADRLGVPHIEIDSLYWGPEWTGTDDEQLAARVAVAAAADRWVIDGNYSRIQPLIWVRADTVIWLDYSFPRSFWQLLRRTARRLVHRETMWSGNRETLRKALSRDSILVWQLKTYRRVRRQYPERFADPRWSHLRVVHLRSPKEADLFLSQVVDMV